VHFPTSLIIVAGFVFVDCLSLVKLTWELSQAGVHESPAILETPGNPATELYESSSTELSDTP
jgi:hypothetical protein